MRSDGIQPVAPGETRVNLVTGDSILAERNRRYAVRADNYSVFCSDKPIAFRKTDIYVLPSFSIPDIDFKRLLQWLPVILYGPAADLRAAYAAGCSDFLKEPWSPEELHMRALKFASHQTFSIGKQGMSLEGTTLRGGGSEISLSAQERAVLSLLLQHRGTCVPRDALSYVARGKPAGNSRAVDMHVSHLRKKIGNLNPEFQRIIIGSVKGVGYIMSANGSNG